MFNSSSTSKTIKKYAEAAAEADDNVTPSSTGGGTLGSAATGTSSTSAPSSTESSDANAGLEARGEIRWGLMSMGLAVAGFVGAMMV